MQRIMIVFKRNAPPIDLNASMFAQIICDPATPTEEVYVFYEPLQIAFPNNVLVSKFRGSS